ncbi:MAG TPA: YqeG family HAD IIIA-type phosphatase [Symbiobacteriaceae bacterium]|nr:YqeG family HAD IIIA-type phosphatase [Symbiobacteriaceae bacterium]
MSQLLRPAEYRRSIHHIDLDRLAALGKKAVLLDLDNTLVEWNAPEPTAELTNWLAAVRARGMQPCLVSNNRGPRVSAFAGKAGLPYVSRAIKPRRKGFREAMAQLGVTPDQTVVVGDQLFTDILGGNRSGAYTILVMPLHPKELAWTKMMRRFERPLLAKWRSQGLHPEE